jgi:FkbM family methyltransferase
MSLEIEKSCLARLERGSVFVDVGANEGVVTRLALDFGHPSELIYAIEPSIDCIPSLDALGVTVTRVALGEALGQVAMFGDGELLSVRERDLDDIGIIHVFKETVPMLTLDFYCESAGVEEIGFLKLDVEGSEAAILRGASGLLEAGAVKEIAFEVLGSDTKFTDGYEPSLEEIEAVLGDGYETVEQVEAMHLARRR